MNVKPGCLKKVASKKQLQNLAGKLHHIAKCVKSARAFTNRILAAIRAAPIYGKHSFDPAVLDDIDWFLKFVASSNSMVLLPKLNGDLTL